MEGGLVMNGILELLALRESHEAIAELLEIGVESVTNEARCAIAMRYWLVSQTWRRCEE